MTSSTQDARLPGSEGVADLGRTTSDLVTLTLVARVAIGLVALHVADDKLPPATTGARPRAITSSAASSR